MTPASKDIHNLSGCSVIGGNYWASSNVQSCGFTHFNVTSHDIIYEVPKIKLVPLNNFNGCILSDIVCKIITYIAE